MYKIYLEEDELKIIKNLINKEMEGVREDINSLDYLGTLETIYDIKLRETNDYNLTKEEKEELEKSQMVIFEILEKIIKRKNKIS